MKKLVMSIALAGALLVAPTVSEATVKMGDRGASVTELQQTLASKGHNSASNVDGVFGPMTLRSVQSYQRSTGISSPAGNFFGVAGPATLSSLGLSSSGSTSTASSSTSTSSSNSTAVAGTSTTSSNSGVISTARSLVGSPYVWGGTSPRGFDCSGFIQYAFAQNGKSIPRTVSQMWSAGSSVSSPSTGDLVFFETRSGPSHAGIYIGGNQFIHSGSSTGVTISSLSNPYWSKTYMGAKRL
ncbi:C40 family peptidase [Alkalicoccus daliensis]|uniref:Cell wall-associated hydrolase, NlpC family n=1 Tax=Alkalicoccus daliensis TaxID=745820 RepID=A0A1H0HH87_9BACI|nr:NlpC/P60 family protein [Alkalicoccus daliensis]SDO18477.1 Cell wall-associated hydrolase, NlpC family [Alkalicoccus daliensis]